MMEEFFGNMLERFSILSQGTKEEVLELFEKESKKLKDVNT